MTSGITVAWPEISGHYKNKTSGEIQAFLYDELCNKKMVNKYQNAQLKHIKSELNISGNIFENTKRPFNISFSHNELTGKVFTSGLIYNTDLNEYVISSKLLSNEYSDIKNNYVEINEVQNIGTVYPFIERETISDRLLNFYRLPTSQKVISTGDVYYLDDKNEKQMLQALYDTKIADSIKILIKERNKHINDAQISGEVINKLPETVTGYISGSTFIETKTTKSGTNKIDFDFSNYDQVKIDYLVTTHADTHMLTSSITSSLIDEWNDYYASNFVKK